MRRYHNMRLKTINLIIYVVVAAVLAVATFLSPAVYGSWWFIALWGAFVLILVLSICATRMWHNAGRFIFHLSFLAMLGGGLLTYLTKVDGKVRIELGQTVNSFTDSNGTKYDLPHAIKLDKFEIVYYPGGIVPRDYVSHLEVDGVKEIVSMNNILDLDGFHLLQFSYDESGATILSVNHDPYGLYLSYAGYLMFALGGLMLLLSKKGRFRRLLRRVAATACLLLTIGFNASASTIDGVPLAHANSLKTQQVIYNGRTVTFNTLSRDILLKIYGKASYRGLTSEQTLLSLKLFPDKWKNEPLIKIKEKTVREALGINGKYARLSDLFDADGNYKVEKLYFTLGSENRRAVEDLDEKVGIILTLFSGELIVVRPDNIEPLSDTHIKLELLYNSIPFTKIIFMILMTGFLIGMALYLLSLSLKKGHGFIRKLPYILLAIATLFSFVAFVMEWYLSGRLPLANTFETLQFVVLIMELLLLMVGCRNKLLMNLGLLMAGALALVAHLVASNPIVTQLMPVLHSGWLSLHVSLVMTSYAILAFTFIIAVAGLMIPSSAERMKMLSMLMLYPGTYLLGLGIFTGAVWANVSWGQYWSWDPKETWALITLLVYTLPLHTSLKIFRSPRCFHLYLLLAILTIAMTYFGVNHLDSLHAY